MAVLKIYQLKDSPDNRFRRWLDYNSLGKLGETPQLQNYDKVYSMKLLDSPTPEQVVWRFSQSRPADFTGHPISASDIIAVQGEAETIVHYVDNGSFVRLPALEQELTAEENKEHEVVGYLRYLDSGEKVNFTNADAFIAAYKEDLNSNGPNGVRAVPLTKDLGVRYEIEKLLVGEFGEKVPDKETWIAAHSNPLQNYCMEHQQQPEPANDGPEL